MRVQSKKKTMFTLCRFIDGLLLIMISISKQMEIDFFLTPYIITINS